jgi:Zn-dependent peptidase ImmA (M78 family)
MKDAGAFYFRETPPEEVEPGMRRAAERVFGYCRRVLDLRDDVRIQWVTAADPEAAEVDELLIKIGVQLGRMAEGLPDPGIKFRKDAAAFCGETGTTSYLRGKILVRADIPRKEVLLTIAHELQHLAEFGPNGKFRPPYTSEETAAADRRAEAFAVSIVERMKKAGDLA